MALNFLGYLLADHDRRLRPEALILKALVHDPDNGAYIDSLGWVYYRLGRLPEARIQLERAVDLTGGDPVVREHLGDVYRDLNLSAWPATNTGRAWPPDGPNPAVQDQASRDLPGSHGTNDRVPTG